MARNAQTFPNTHQHATLLLRDTAFSGTGHDPGSHPENPGRLQAIERALESSGLKRSRPTLPFHQATDEAILRVHTPAHLRHLNEVTLRGGGRIDHDTMMGPKSLEVARLAAGAGIAAVDYVLNPETTHPRAFVLGRPPGHHATADRAMGFCLLNTIAISAAHACARGLHRVAIVDLDVHHGNGTQDVFYGRSDVFFCSIHQWPLYPGTGSSHETGVGDGSSWTLNIPLPPGSGDDIYLQAIDDNVMPALQNARPELILVSAGFDAHLHDPLSNMNVTTQGFGKMMERMVYAANALCGGRLVVVLEGGYDPDALAASVVATIAELDTPLA